MPQNAILIYNLLRYKISNNFLGIFFIKAPNNAYPKQEITVNLSPQKRRSSVMQEPHHS